MKKTFIEVNAWNIQRIIQTMEAGDFDPEYIENEVDWIRLSKFGRISEFLMDKYADYFIWSLLCIHQTMSEEFIRSHMDYIKPHMFGLCYSQQLSIDFIRDYQDNINWAMLSRNKHLTDDIKEEFHDKLAAYLDMPPLKEQMSKLLKDIDG